MSNKGGKQKKHCLVGKTFKRSPFHKRFNKDRAQERKAAANLEWQEMLAGS